MFLAVPQGLVLSAQNHRVVWIGKDCEDHPVPEDQVTHPSSVPVVQLFLIALYFYGCDVCRRMFDPIYVFVVFNLA